MQPSDVDSKLKELTPIHNAPHITDLQIVQHDKDTKIITLRWYAKIPLLGHLISYICFKLSNQNDIKAFQTAASKIIQGYKDWDQKFVINLFETADQNFASRTRKVYQIHKQLSEICSKLGQAKPASMHQYAIKHFKGQLPDELIITVTQTLESKKVEGLADTIKKIRSVCQLMTDYKATLGSEIDPQSQHALYKHKSSLETLLSNYDALEDRLAKLSSLQKRVQMLNQRLSNAKDPDLLVKDQDFESDYCTILGVAFSELKIGETQECQSAVIAMDSLIDHMNNWRSYNDILKAEAGSRHDLLSDFRKIFAEKPGKSFALLAKMISPDERKEAIKMLLPARNSLGENEKAQLMVMAKAHPDFQELAATSIKDVLKEFNLDLPGLEAIIKNYNERFSSESDPSGLVLDKEASNALKALKELEAQNLDVLGENGEKFSSHMNFWGSYQSILKSKRLHDTQFFSELLYGYPKNALKILLCLPERTLEQKKTKASAFKLYLERCYAPVDNPDLQPLSPYPEADEEKAAFLFSAYKLKIFDQFPEFAAEAARTKQVPKIFGVLLDRIKDHLKRELKAYPEPIIQNPLLDEAFAKIEELKNTKASPTDQDSTFDYLKKQRDALVHILSAISPSLLEQIDLPCIEAFVWANEHGQPDISKTKQCGDKCEVHAALEDSINLSTYYRLVAKDEKVLKRFENISNNIFFDSQIIKYFKHLVSLDFTKAINLLVEMRELFSIKYLSKFVLDKYATEKQTPFHSHSRWEWLK